MAIVTTIDISNGRTALDAVASRNKQKHSRFICMPVNSGSGHRKHVFSLDSEERLYDLGLIENWRTVFQLARNQSNYRRSVYVSC